MAKTVDIYSKTIDTFMVNNDQRVSTIEEEPLTEAELSITLDYYSNYSMADEIDTIKQQDVLLSQHHLLHMAFEQLKKGSIIRDHKTDEELSMMDLLEKHRQYVTLMKELGINHVLMDAGKELDDIYYKLQEVGLDLAFLSLNEQCNRNHVHPLPERYNHTLSLLYSYRVQLIPQASPIEPTNSEYLFLHE